MIYFSVLRYVVLFFVMMFWSAPPLIRCYIRLFAISSPLEFAFWFFDDGSSDIYFILFYFEYQYFMCLNWILSNWSVSRGKIILSNFFTLSLGHLVDEYFDWFFYNFTSSRASHYITMKRQKLKENSWR